MTDKQAVPKVPYTKTRIGEQFTFVQVKYKGKLPEVLKNERTVGKQFTGVQVKYALV